VSLHEFHPHIRWTAKKIGLIFFFTILIFVFTLFAVKKTTAGYLNFGNTFVILISLYFGPEISVFSAGVGSSLADLALKRSDWAIQTLIIKSTMALIISFLSRRRPDIKLSSLTTFVGALVGSIYCAIMYAIASGIMTKNYIIGFYELKWLLIEGAVNFVLFYIVGFIVSKTRLYKMLYN